MQKLILTPTIFFFCFFFGFQSLFSFSNTHYLKFNLYMSIYVSMYDSAELWSVSIRFDALLCDAIYHVTINIIDAIWCEATRHVLPLFVTRLRIRRMCAPTCCSSVAALVSTNTTFSATINSIHQRVIVSAIILCVKVRRNKHTILLVLLLHFNCLCICVDSVWLFIYADLFLKAAMIYTLRYIHILRL